MTIIAGSVAEFTLAGRVFSVAADADVTIDPGGKTNTYEPNGDQRTTRVVWTRRPWMISGLKIAIDEHRGDIEWLLDVQNQRLRGAHVDARGYAGTITLAGGESYAGIGNITSPIAVATRSMLADLELCGDGELLKDKGGGFELGGRRLL